jgi:hypothetical protein
MGVMREFCGLEVYYTMYERSEKFSMMGMELAMVGKLNVRFAELREVLL